MPIPITVKEETPLAKELGKYASGVQGNLWAIFDILNCEGPNWTDKQKEIQRTLMDCIWMIAKMDRIMKAEEG